MQSTRLLMTSVSVDHRDKHEVNKASEVDSRCEAAARYQALESLVKEIHDTASANG